MANKGFGVRELTLIESIGTPTLSVPQNLDIDAVVVGISTGLVVGGAVTIAGPLGVSTITSTGRITATEINAEYYYTESADNNADYNIPFMGDAQSGNSYSALQVDHSVLQFNPGTNILKTNNLEATGYIDSNAGYIGDGSQLSGIVTSIVAGSDVTISQTAGAVTINSTSGVGSDASVNTTGIITAASFDTTGFGAATIRVAVGNTLNIEAPIVAVSTDMTVGGLATISNLSVPTLADLPVIGPGLGQTTRLNANQVAISTNCSVGNDLTIGGNIGLTGNINSNGGTLNINSNDFRVFNSAGTVKRFEANSDGINITGITTVGKLSIGDATGNTGDNSLALGDSDDAKIYYQSNAAGGTLQIQCDKISLRAKTGLESPIISGEYNAEAKLWYAGTPRLETTSAGVQVSGIATASSFKTNSTTGNGSDNGYGITYDITANGSSAYRFAGPGIVNTIDNPTLYLHRGFTYHLVNTTGGHPFRIQYAGTATGYGSTYLTGSQTGTQVFTVPFDAPGTLEYECTSHSSMVGTFIIPT